MIKMLYILVAIMGFSPIVVAQQYASLTSSTDTIFMGDPFTLDLKVKTLEGSSFQLNFAPLDTMANQLYAVDTINFSPYADYAIISSEPFELAENRMVVTSDQLRSEGNGVFSGTIEIAIYDPGIFIFPSPELLGASGEIMNTASDAIVVTLPPGILNEIQDSIQLAPIKPIIEEPLALEDFKIGFIILGTVLLALLFIYLSRKWKKEKIEDEVPEEVISIPPHIMAIQKLDSLKEKELWQKGEIKSYQSELTYIIREYLENRFGIDALESTTDEILNDIPEEVPQDELKEILQIADLVKFAKANPPADIHSRFLDKAYDLVQITKMIVSDQTLSEDA